LKNSSRSFCSTKLKWTRLPLKANANNLIHDLRESNALQRSIKGATGSQAAAIRDKFLKAIGLCLWRKTELE